jgi:hypothetical protein
MTATTSTEPDAVAKATAEFIAQSDREYEPKYGAPWMNPLTLEGVA